MLYAVPAGFAPKSGHRATVGGLLAIVQPVSAT